MRASRSGFITEYKATYEIIYHKTHNTHPKFSTKVTRSRLLLRISTRNKSLLDGGTCKKWFRKISDLWRSSKDVVLCFLPSGLLLLHFSPFWKFSHVTKMRDDWHRTGILQVLNACKTSPTCFRFSVHDIILTSIKALISLFQRESQTFERWCSFKLPLWRQSFFYFVLRRATTSVGLSSRTWKNYFRIRDKRFA